MKDKAADNDKLLVKQLMLGNDMAFRSLFDAYYPRIYAYSFSILKTKTLAEETVQDVFLKVWKNRECLNLNMSFRAYIFTIARNKAFSIISKATNDKKLREQIFYKSQKSYNPIETMLDNADCESLKSKAINELPPKRKLIFLMSREEHKTYAEISDELKISISTVKGQMSKALQTIREVLKSESDIIFTIVFVVLGWRG